MTKSEIEIDKESLGTFLRRTRTELGIPLAKLAEETKISTKNLVAIETSDFDALPAEAFTRGFYTLYAKVLSLEPEEILTRYAAERGIQYIKPQSTTPPPYKRAQNVGNMAEKPSILPFSYFGLFLLILLVVGALICWYFSWNPATYLSEQLRAIEAPETVNSTPYSAPAPATDIIDEEHDSQQHSRAADLFSVSSPATAGVVPPAIFSPPPPPPPPRYTVNAYFNDTTKVKLTIDDQAQQVITFGPGDSATWQGETKLRIIAIGKHKPQLTLNSIPIDLPKNSSKTVSVTIPDSLLK